VQPPRLPLDETRRLRALTTLCVLDTLPEERFDRVTRLARRTFQVPIALVSLIDRDRQWFKSNQGLPGVCETSREVSFCGHAILYDSAMVVPDARLNPIFSDNPLVTGDPHVRFYAGQPVHGPDGSRVGTLCLIDRKPRQFTEDDRIILADLGAMVDRELALIESATVDELTRLSNRRGFLTVATHVLNLCRRNRLPATVVTFDLDRFKSINDELGHDAGDDVLRRFSRLLHAHFQSADVVARFGGDEFCVLSSDGTAEDMQQSLIALQQEFTASTLAERYPHLSWSAGVAMFEPQTGQTLDELLKLADARMYCAKAEGRAAAPRPRALSSSR
jgi:diguanylate cyclase (GGDEF)-like protein